MVARWIETLTGPLDQKKQYRQAKARLDALPAPYGPVAAATQRYWMATGMIMDGEILVTMLGDFADLLEGAAADQTPVREIIGTDPVAFAEDFARAYAGKEWLDKERARLVQAIETAERDARS